MKVRFNICALGVLLAVALGSCSSADDEALLGEEAAEAQETVLCGTTPATEGVAEFSDISDLYSTVHSDFAAEALAEGGQGVGYRFTAETMYRYDGASYRFYEYPEAMYGNVRAVPTKFILKDGRMWTPYCDVFDYPNETLLFAQPLWEIYCRLTGSEGLLYVGSDPALDTSARRISVKKSEYSLLLLTRSYFAITQVKSDDIYYVNDYQRDDADVSSGQVLYFASRRGAERHVLDVCRAKFGRYMEYVWYDDATGQEHATVCDLDLYEERYRQNELLDI